MPNETISLGAADEKYIFKLMTHYRHKMMTTIFIFVQQKGS